MVANSMAHQWVDEADGACDRPQRLLARIRRKQLVAALEGRIADSARFADRAKRLRLLSKQLPKPPEAAAA